MKIILLIGIVLGDDFKNFTLIASDKILPPKNYRNAFNTPVSSSDAATNLNTLNFVATPHSSDGTTDLSEVNLHMHSTEFADDTSSASSSSITAQAVVDGMNLQQCVAQVKFTNSQYSVFSNKLAGTAMQVKQASMKLDQIDIITHNILSDEPNFEAELNRLNELYNTLAVRGNALGKWMSDEKYVRDNLEELYRSLVSKNHDEENRLGLLRSNLKAAMTRLAEVEKQTAFVLSEVADAQVAMYDWAANVTVSVNTHTTKLNSLMQAMQYRITQMDHVVPAMRDMGKRAMSICRSLGETNLAYAAANVVSHVESVIDSALPSDTIMDIPGTS